MCSRLTAFFILLFFLLDKKMTAQNLVPNGDFEGQKNKMTSRPWTLINTVDYFKLSNSSSDNSKKDDKNQLGHKPHSGKGYVGLRIWGYYREYIQVKLNEPLRPGEKYSLKFYVAISPWCNSVAGEIGACLTEKAQSLANNSVISMKPQVQRFFDRTCKDSLSWMLVSDTFTAKGGEKFLSLGYFGKKEKTKLIKKKVLHMTLVREAYYYVDDVSLFRFDAEGKDITAPQPLTREELKKIPIDTLQAGNYLEKQVKQDSSIVMKNIFFASGRSDLLPESFEELGLLVDLLNSDPGLEIEIVGHTDNTGNEEENKKLSFHRAEAVVKYLVDNGIAPQRLTCSGKGSDEPLSTNDTEEGKQQNRRVEFRVVKK